MDWELAKTIAAAVQSATAAVIAVGGLVWGYLRFVRFRTFKPRLEFSFEWTCSDEGESKSVAILTLKLTNRGNTKVELRKEDNHRCFFKYALISAEATDQAVSLISHPPKKLKHLDTAFAAHRRIEPGETIDDVKVLHIRRAGHVAMQFEVVIFGTQKWSASAAFPLIAAGSNAGSSTEDEQDDYEELEAAKEGLENSLARATRAMQERAGDERRKLEGLMEAVTTFLGRSLSTHDRDEAERLKKELDKYLD